MLCTGTVQYIGMVRSWVRVLTTGNTTNYVCCTYIVKCIQYGRGGGGYANSLRLPLALLPYAFQLKYEALWESRIHRTYFHFLKEQLAEKNLVATKLYIIYIYLNLS